MSDLVGNPEDRFSHVAAQFTNVYFDDGLECLCPDQRNETIPQYLAFLQLKN